jgi:putative transposase
MPRHARFMLAGIPVHLVQRGNNRAACFASEGDYGYYLHLLGKLAPRAGCAIHAYCLMTNHVHLLLTPRASDSCAQLMKNLGQRYVQYFNRTYRRTGTLWEGRFRSCLVQTEDYLLACYRYIELNPVRASLVSHPRDHSFSSYRSNAEGSPNALLTPHAEYLRLGNTAAERLTVYGNLVAAGFGAGRVDEIRLATNGGFALGGDEFQAAIAQTLGRRVARGKAGRPFKSQSETAARVDLLD